VPFTERLGPALLAEALLSRPLGSGNTGGVEWVPPEPRLEAPGVALRPFRVSDAAAGADACRDPAILRFTFMEDDLTEAGAVDWINEATEWWSRGQPRFAIVDPDDDRLLGQVGLGVNSRHLSGEGYYWVVPSERGRGVASAALGLVADWGVNGQVAVPVFGQVKVPTSRVDQVVLGRLPPRLRASRIR